MLINIHRYCFFFKQKTAYDMRISDLSSDVCSSDLMNERFQFISKQKNDLVEAKVALLNTIGEIDETARNQFLEAFAQIKHNFQQVFRSLFNQDDSCDLFLVT